MPCSQPPWRRLNRTQQTNTEQLNLAKLVLATPLKTKQCMIMLVSFWQVWRNHRILRRQKQNVLRTLGHRPCATNITATKLLPRLLYRRLCGSKGSQGSSKGGVTVVDPPTAPCLVSRRGRRETNYTGIDPKCFCTKKVHVKNDMKTFSLQFYGFALRSKNPYSLPAIWGKTLGESPRAFGLRHWHLVS